MLERRGVVGGAAVTEEFHPGFRNSVAAYTVSLLQPKVIRDLDLAAHGLKIVQRKLNNFLPLPDGRYLTTGRAQTQAEIAKFSRRDAERLPEYERRLEAIADVLRALALEPPPNVTRRQLAQGAAGTVARGAPRQAAQETRRDAAHGSAGSVRDLRRRISRSLFRERTDQGRARLRRHRRQLCEPVHAGLGVRAAASRVRRGERRQGRVGPRHRRHGRDHAGDGEGRDGAGRRDPHRRRRARSHRRRTDARSASSREKATSLHARAIVANVNPKLLVRAPDRTRCRAGAGARAHGELALRLGHVPHERRAVGVAALHCLPRARRSSDRRHHHGAESRLHGPRLSRRARIRLVARADRRDADSFDARRQPRAGRAACREPVLPARRAGACRTDDRGTIIATKSPI